ncbi:MAG: glycosyltransferase family 39 protein [Vicinamibacteria bacterium]
MAVLSAALLTAGAYQAPWTYRVDVGGADAPYVDGFGPPQRFRHTTWRWTDDASRLIFHDAGQIVGAKRSTLRIRLAAPRPEGEPPPLLEMALNGRPLPRLSPPAEFIEGIWAVDGRVAGTGDWALSFQSETFQKDGRRLGVQVDWVEIEAEQGPGWPPLRTTALVLTTVALLFGISGRRNRWTQAAPFATGLALSGGIAFARESTVALLPALTACVGVLALWSHLRRRGWAARAVDAVDRSGLRGASLGAAVALAFAGQAVLSLGGPVAAVAPLLVGVTVAALLVTTPVPQQVDGPAPRREALILTAIVMLALAFRLYALESVPFSLFRDEARHGLVALQILRDPTYRPVFVPPPVSQPAAYMYALAWVFGHWGASALTLRVVSAVVGALAVPLLWAFLRRPFGSRVALLAAFALATSSWHIAISRFAMPYVLPTLLALPAYGLLRRALDGGGARCFAAAGLAIGLAQYGAQTSRVLGLVALAMIADALRTAERGDARSRRRIAGGAVLTLAVAVVAAGPLLAAAHRDPEAFLARTREVALWNGGGVLGDYFPRILARNVFRYVGAFNVEGDWNGRHHLPGAPLLDPVSAVFVGIGVIVAARTLRNRDVRWMAIWFVAGLVPGFLSADAPTALRILEATPAVYAIAALGLVGVFGGFPSLGVAAVLASTVLAFNAWTYFGRMYESPAVWRRGGAIASRLGETLRDARARGVIPPGTPVFVPTALLASADDGDVLRFLTGDEVAIGVYDRGPMPSGRPAAIVVPNYADFWRLVAAQEPGYAPMVPVAEDDERNWRGRLAPLLTGEAVVGSPFPGSHRPTFWLYLLR